MSEWLRNISEELVQYEAAFSREGFETKESLALLSDDDLRAIGVSKMAHRKMLLAATRKSANPAEEPAPLTVVDLALEPEVEPEAEPESHEAAEDPMARLLVLRQELSHSLQAFQRQPESEVPAPPGHFLEFSEPAEGRDHIGLMDPLPRDEEQEAPGHGPLPFPLLKLESASSAGVFRDDFLLSGHLLALGVQHSASSKSRKLEAASRAKAELSRAEVPERRSDAQVADKFAVEQVLLTRRRELRGKLAEVRSVGMTAKRTAAPQAEEPQSYPVPRTEKEDATVDEILARQERSRVMREEQRTKWEGRVATSRKEAESSPPRVPNPTSASAQPAKQPAPTQQDPISSEEEFSVPPFAPVRLSFRTAGLPSYESVEDADAASFAAGPLLIQRDLLKPQPSQPPAPLTPETALRQAAETKQQMDKLSERLDKLRRFVSQERK